MPRRMRCFQTASKSARSGGSGGVAGQIGQAADGEVEVVEGGQRAPVTDADDDAVGQAVADQGVEHGLGRFVQRGGGFVEQDELRGGQQDAGEGDALEFAGREALLPVVGGIEQRFEVSEAAFAQGGGDVLRIGGDVGVADGLQQRALRHIGFLRDEQGAAARRAADFSAAAERPQSGQRTQQGGFAAAAGALDQQ